MCGVIWRETFTRDERKKIERDLIKSIYYYHCMAGKFMESRCCCCCCMVDMLMLNSHACLYYLSNATLFLYRQRFFISIFTYSHTSFVFPSSIFLLISCPQFTHLFIYLFPFFCFKYQNTYIEMCVISVRK